MGDPAGTSDTVTARGGAGGADAVAELSHLLSCIGPTCGDAFDWKGLEAVYGRALPSDYRQFIGIFGRGTIEQLVVVRGPATGRPEWEGIRVDTLVPEMLRDTADDWRMRSQNGLYAWRTCLFGPTLRRRTRWPGSPRTPIRTAGRLPFGRAATRPGRSIRSGWPSSWSGCCATSSRSGR